jgi:putative membrane protein
MIDWGDVWPWTKATGVIAITVFHHWLAARRKGFAAGVNTLSGRHYRIMNEVPTVFLIIIVFSVVLRF